MRVHGNIVLKRSTGVSAKNNYKDYKDDLRNDFSNICGYCAKHETHCTKGFEIDHLVPKKIDEDRITDYTNLVYSCFTCNRKKGGKWPTGDKNTPHNDKEGFVDPVTSEYDDHLERSAGGEITGRTELGQYLCKVFRFDMRPIKELWLYAEIEREQERFEKLVAEQESKISQEKLLDYVKINTQLRELRKKFFICGE